MKKELTLVLAGLMMVSFGVAQISAPPMPGSGSTENTSPQDTENREESDSSEQTSEDDLNTSAPENDNEQRISNESSDGQGIESRTEDDQDSKNRGFFAVIASIFSSIF